MMAKGPIRMLYVIGRDFTGFELEALWDDSAFGLRHWHFLEPHRRGHWSRDDQRDG